MAAHLLLHYQPPALGLASGLGVAHGLGVEVATGAGGDVSDWQPANVTSPVIAAPAASRVRTSRRCTRLPFGTQSCCVSFRVAVVPIRPSSTLYTLSAPKQADELSIEVGGLGVNDRPPTCQ
jgi:hypothetical protein